MEKVCFACRKAIDKNATICPFCRSVIDYDCLTEIKSDDIVRKTSFIIKSIAFMILSILVGISLITGLALFGFWVGIFCGLIMIAIIAAIYDSLRIGGTDKAKIDCPFCDFTSEYSWNFNALSPGSRAKFICSKCKHKIFVAVTQ
ncbi:MAG: hypothetical protein M0036_05145 [Desulfobacteraceae bacterium]|nr:hypothetical protein [Desulfobacteraceae bacterium]